MHDQALDAETHAYAYLPLSVQHILLIIKVSAQARVRRKPETRSKMRSIVHIYQISQGKVVAEAAEIKSSAILSLGRIEHSTSPNVLRIGHLAPRTVMDDNPNVHSSPAP